MVARGDLGIEVPYEELPIIQRRIVKTCLHVGQPVIVATHMLESMIQSPMPTRAEVTDVANAVFEQADAIMLSGETTVGKYPMKCVEVFDRIAQRIERSGGANYWEHAELKDPREKIAKSAVVMANELRAAAIISLIRSGSMTRYLSWLRPKYSVIYAIGENPDVAEELTLNWGVSPLVMQFDPHNLDKNIELSLNTLLAGTCSIAGIPSSSSVPSAPAARSWTPSRCAWFNGSRPGGWSASRNSMAARIPSGERDRPAKTTLSDQPPRRTGFQRVQARIGGHITSQPQRRDRLRGEIHQRVGKQTQIKHSRAAAIEGDSRHRRNADGREVRRFLRPVNRADHAEIIINRNQHAENRRREQPVIRRDWSRPVQHDFAEQQKFAKKTRQRRNARQRHHRQRQRRGQQRRTLVQPRQRGNVLAVHACASPGR